MKDNKNVQLEVLPCFFAFKPNPASFPESK